MRMLSSPPATPADTTPSHDASSGTYCDRFTTTTPNSPFCCAMPFSVCDAPTKRTRHPFAAARLSTSASSLSLRGRTTGDEVTTESIHVLNTAPSAATPHGPGGAALEPLSAAPAGREQP
jgi:hypothetical protein